MSVIHKRNAKGRSLVCAQVVSSDTLREILTHVQPPPPLFLGLRHAATGADPRPVGAGTRSALERRGGCAGRGGHGLERGLLEPLGVVRRRPEDGHERASGQRELRLGSTSEIHTGKEAVSGPGMAKPLGGAVGAGSELTCRDTL